MCTGKRTLLRLDRLVLTLLTLATAGCLFALWHRRYNAFASMSDLAFHCEAAWLIGYGRLFQSSHILGYPPLADHCSLIWFPLGWIFHIAPHPFTLMVVQLLAVASGVFPVYRLALRQLADTLCAFACAALYLVYPPLLLHSLHDFYPDLIAVPALLWLVVAVEEKRAWLLALSLVCALSCKEVVALPLASFGAVLIIRQWRRRFGITILLASLLWFTIAVSVLIPALLGGRERPMFRAAYGHLGMSLGEAIRNIFWHPQLILSYLLSASSLIVLFQLLFPLAFTPLLKPLLMVPALTGAAINLLSKWGEFHEVHYHQFAISDPFLIAGAIGALGKIAGRRWFDKIAKGKVAPKAALVKFGGCAALTAWCLSTGFLIFPKPDWEQARHCLNDPRRQAELRAAIETVPPNALVSATNHLLPHFRVWQGLFPFPRPFKVIRDALGRPKAVVPPPNRFFATNRPFYILAEWGGMEAKEVRDDLHRIANFFSQQPGFQQVMRGQYVLVLRYQPSKRQ